MSDVAKILEVLAAQEEDRLQKEALLSQRDSDLAQRKAGLARLREELAVALQNREYNKSLVIEQLQRNPAFHGEAIAQLLADTFEAIFIHLYPNVDKPIKTLMLKIERLENHQEEIMNAKL